MLKKSFYIKVMPNGTQYPILNVAPDQYEMLYELGMYRFSKSVGVQKVMEKFKDLKCGNINFFELSAGDWCVVHVREHLSIITNNFEEFEPIEINTSELELLMKEWLDFLLAYEKNEIPGVVYPAK